VGWFERDNIGRVQGLIPPVQDIILSVPTSIGHGESKEHTRKELCVLTLYPDKPSVGYGLRSERLD
jgi:hypothetical protein